MHKYTEAQIAMHEAGWKLTVEYMHTAAPLRDGRSLTWGLPHSPALVSASAVGADGRLAPPTTELNALAIVAKMPRPLAAVPSWPPLAVRCLDWRASALEIFSTVREHIAMMWAQSASASSGHRLAGGGRKNGG